MLFSDVWSENAPLCERLMEIHSNPPILYMYYGFKVLAVACSMIKSKLNIQYSIPKSGDGAKIDQEINSHANTQISLISCPAFDKSGTFKGLFNVFFKHICHKNLLKFVIKTS